MARHRRDDENSTGQDSFLDIVANIVGILIILVLVVAVRAKNAPVLSVSAREQAEKREHAIDQDTEESVYQNVLEVAAEMERVEAAKRLRFIERGQLALAVAQIEQEIGRRRAELDAQAQLDFDQRRALDAARARLDSLRRAQQQVAASVPDPIRIENYPTPLSRTVNGHEVHVQLRGGRLTVVPMDEMVNELKAVFPEKARRAWSQGELTSQLGPIDGYVMHYELRRYDTPMAVYEQTGQGGSYVRLEHFELRPTSDMLGEPIDAALAEGSLFRRRLAQLNPERTTITVWIYPESFEDFRRLKKDLFHLGFTTAARPLPEGMYIGGSPDGSRSAAQ